MLHGIITNSAISSISNAASDALSRAGAAASVSDVNSKFGVVSDAASKAMSKASNALSRAGAATLSILAKGSGVLNSTTGVTITHNLNLAASAYRIMITITSATTGYVGEIYVLKSVASNNVAKIFNTGSDVTATFDWMIVAA